MAARKITYTDKAEGVIWSSNDANEIKEVVNSHADDLDSINSQVNLNTERVEGSVLTAPQNLTEAQKEQARNNIDAEPANFIYYDQIDSLNDFSLCLGGKKARYVVLFLRGRGYKVGILDIFSDTMHHVLTQVFTTTEQINENGQLFGEHTDNDVRQYYRSFNYNSPYLPTARNAWTPWKQLSPSNDDFETLNKKATTMLLHTGIVDFNGFVDNVEIQNVSATSGMWRSAVFDITRKVFLGMISTSFLSAPRYYLNYALDGHSPSHYGDAENNFTPWKYTIFRCLEDGKSYMWNGTDLIPIHDSSFKSMAATVAAIRSGILYRWDDVQSLDITLSEGHADGKEYMMEFTVSGSEFAFSVSPSPRWMNDEEPEWESGWTYQVSIENGLAVYGGWPANE